MAELDQLRRSLQARLPTLPTATIDELVSIITNRVPALPTRPKLSADDLSALLGTSAPVAAPAPKTKLSLADAGFEVVDPEAERQSLLDDMRDTTDRRLDFGHSPSFAVDLRNLTGADLDRGEALLKKQK